jgi:ABC-type lipoprotein release transport system permease subunit
MVSLSTLRIAWRNLARNRRRTALVAGAIALGQFTLVAVNCMMAGMYDNMLRTITGPLLGHVQVRHPEWREDRAADLCVDDLSRVVPALRRVGGLRRVSPRLYAPVLAAAGGREAEPAQADTGMIVGMDCAAEHRAGGLLANVPGHSLPAGGRVLVGHVLANRIGVKAGDSIALIGQDADEFPASGLFTVAAVVRSEADVVNRGGVVMSLAEAGRFLALTNHAHEVLVQGDDPKRADSLAGAIAALPELQRFDVLSWREAAPELTAIIDMKDRFDLIFVAIVFVAAAAGIVNTMMMSTFERSREFGMLLAIGSRPGRVVRMVVAESVILGLLGVAVGSALGALAVHVTSRTGINYAALTSAATSDTVFTFKGLNISYVLFPKFEWRHVLFGVGAVTATSVLAALWPACAAARRDPAEVMRS